MRNIIFMILFFLLFSCSKQEKKIEPVVEKINGVEYIHNPAEPLHSEKTVDLEYERTYDGIDENGEVVIYRINNFYVGENGKLYFFDYTDRKIKVFDPKGKFVMTIGRKGQGPGEFLLASNMTELQNNNFIIHDLQNFRTNFFDQNGNFLNSYSFKGHRTDIYLVTDSIYISKEFRFVEKKGYKKFVKAFEISGKELYTFFICKELERIENDKINSDIPFTPSSVIAADRKNMLIYHCRGDKYLIDVYNLKGDLIRKIEKSYNIIPITEEFIKNFWDYLIKKNPRSKRSLEKSRKEIPKPDYFPVTKRMVVDDYGNLWVETFEKKEVNGKELTAIDIFNEKGFYETKIWIEVKPKIIKNNKLYELIYNDDTGSNEVRRYNITWIEDIKSKKE